MKPYTRGHATLRQVLFHLEHRTFADALSADTGTFLQTKRSEILDLVGHTEHFAQILKGGR